MGKKRGVGEEAPEVENGQQCSESIYMCYFNRQINKERYQLLQSLSSGKTYVPKFIPIPRREYSDINIGIFIIVSLSISCELVRKSWPKTPLFQCMQSLTLSGYHLILNKLCFNVPQVSIFQNDIFSFSKTLSH